jgi:predicted DCC family thiol-disulfide oxidoreductase YuxK
VEEAQLSREVPWVIFDGDCAFCTSSAHWVARRLNRPFGPNAQLVPWQFTDLVALGTTAERAQREALWVATDGAIDGGAAAFAEWLRFRGGGYAVAGRLLTMPLARSVASAVYRLIARNRHRMPGGSPACALPPPGFDPAQPGTKAL